MTCGAAVEWGFPVRPVPHYIQKKKKKTKKRSRGKPPNSEALEAGWRVKQNHSKRQKVQESQECTSTLRVTSSLQDPEKALNHSKAQPEVRKDFRQCTKPPDSEAVPRPKDLKDGWRVKKKHDDWLAEDVRQAQVRLSLFSSVWSCAFS